MPLLALHRRFVLGNDKMATAPDLSLRGRSAPVAISGRHSQPVQAAVKMEKAEIWGVAALTAQPLAALPPYGCGVPFTGSERLAGWQCLRHKFRGARLPDLSLRGGAADVAISGRHCRPVQAVEETYTPIASVAALSERPWQLQVLGYLRQTHTPCRGRRPRRPFGIAFEFAGVFLLSNRALRDCHGRRAPSQ